MKSLLVDVLRQAQDESPEDVAEQRHAETDQPLKEPDAAALPGRGLHRERPRSEADELNLLESGTYRVENADPAAEPASLPAPGSITDEQPAMDAATAPATPPLDATVILHTRGATLSERKPLIAKIGRLTPVLCLIAMSASATAYMLVNRLAVLNLNEDLADISARFRTNTDGSGDAVGWQNMPVTDINVFDQVVSRIRNDAPSAGVERGTTNTPVQEPADGSAQSSAGSIVDADITIGKLAVARGAHDDRAYAFVAEAYAAYVEGDYARAEQQYEQALSVEANHHDALIGLAAIYQQTAREDKALRAYEKLLALDPDNTLAAAEILAIRSARGGWDSESELKHLLQRFPDAHHLHFALGAVYVGQDRWPDARHEFLAALALDPQNADYSYNLAVSMERLGEYSAARTHYETALANAGRDSRFDRRAISAHLDELAAMLRERS